MTVRIGIVGVGSVGTSVAVSVLHSGIANEVLLHDIRTDRTVGEALDLEQGSSFYPTATVRAVAFDNLLDTDAVVLSAGRNGRPGETRLDLLKDNAVVAADLGRRLRGYRGVVVVVSNPVDILTRIVQEASALPKTRVIGTGTMLDTARLRQMLGAMLQLDPRVIHASVVGEHGDSQVVLWNSAHVGGRRLREWDAWDPADEPHIAARVRGAAGEIISRKGVTNHAIGLVTAALLRWLVRGERRILTVSRVQDGAFGLNDVALSLPCIVGANGAEQVIEPDTSPEELEAIRHSAEVLAAAHESVAPPT
ncbi:MAG: hypothetical protein KDD69_20020 [Bdellovibrionales bacterium]|nr:hypothetical protein [Bdellovibrionales bacterium]